MEQLRAELHCHNEFSNFHVGKLDAPYDCNITIQEQIEKSYQLGLDSLFVTNHNTLDGYRELLNYKNDHEKFKNIQIYPAEEISTNDGSHIIAYGISEPIKSGLSFEEILDEIKKQDAISSAPHPFSLLDALRDKAQNCDLIEVFNSNNVDVLANTKATIFAQEHNITGVAGSDSHVLSTLGRCVNVIESENNLDSILSAMKHKKISIQQTGYATAKETIDHLRYKIDNSTEFIHDYMTQFYPKSKKIFSLLLELFERNPNSYLWILFYKFAIFAMKRISRKINFQDYDPFPMKDRNISSMLKMAF
ncbi:metal-dependent phosphoesterase [Nitrosopumilus sp. b1]|uniref:PHP-associated domain-containing protein n=1 Tax=Nitrosopumilus sp. b1 TaxID=2109907 RepID=UPI0015F5BDC1|nr:PHP domain-containing protein [Nitrosopumilus sp. b1]KAF6242962.1 metal-dependent phosphoesterase [Nitrosopumilus sp. b1]